MQSNPDLIRAWYEKFRNELSDQGVWLLGGEPNTDLPENYLSAGVRILICRLSPYRVVTTGLTNSVLYRLAKQVANVFCDFAYLPYRTDERLMRKYGIPLWLGTTTKRPPTDFDILAISNSVVQELINLPAMLYYSGIPLSREERIAQKSPFVLLGGSNSYATAILHGNIKSNTSIAGLVDGVIVGDGEIAFPKFIEVFSKNRTLSRSELLTILRAEVPGFLDPGAYYEEYGEDGTLKKLIPVENAHFPIKASRTYAIVDPKIYADYPIWFNEESATSGHLIISFGCPYFCSFCKESWEQKPYRELAATELVDIALSLKKNLGLAEINLMSFNANSHTELHDLFDLLDPFFHRVTMKSQRFNAIAKNCDLIDRQVDAGKRVYTCAIEGISQRLRKFLMKCLSEEEILCGFKNLFARYVRRIKTFVIITGEETKEDYFEFASFLEKLKRVLAQSRAKPEIIFSLAALFRPPHTPLQFMNFPQNPVSLKEAFKQTIRVIENEGFSYRISAGTEDAYVSEILAHADRRLTPLLVEASIDREFRYYGTIEPDILDFFCSKGAGNLIFAGQRTLETTFPWDIVSTGVSKKFLWETFKKISCGEELSPCEFSLSKDGVCWACGACLTKLQLGKMKPETAKIKGGLYATKSSKPLKMRLYGVVPKRLAQVGNGFLAADFARMIMNGKPDWIPRFLYFSEFIFRRGFYGFVAADFLLRDGDCQISIDDIAKMNKYGRDLTILSIFKPEGKTIEESCLPLWARFFEDDCSVEEIPIKVDQFLRQHNLKHLKTWDKEILFWKLNPGYIKKTGISEFCWLKNSNIVVAKIVASPDFNLLGKFSNSKKRELVVKDTDPFRSEEG